MVRTTTPGPPVILQVGPEIDTQPTSPSFQQPKVDISQPVKPVELPPDVLSAGTLGQAAMSDMTVLAIVIGSFLVSALIVTVVILSLKVSDPIKGIHPSW